jgi:hypothetical protein
MRGFPNIYDDWTKDLESFVDRAQAGQAASPFHDGKKRCIGRPTHYRLEVAEQDTIKQAEIMKVFA